MKRLLLIVFDFYIQSSIHVALAVVSLLCVFVHTEEVPADLNLILTLFFGVITGYNFVKYAAVAKLHHRSLTRSLRVIQFFSFICFLLMCFFGSQLPYKTLITFGIIGGVTFLYAVPLLAFKSVRSISGIKIYVVALCWSFAVIVVPTVHYQLTMDNLFIIKVIQAMCLVVALIIPFDIRDLTYDNKKLNTIPQQLGVPIAKGLAVILVLLFYMQGIYLRGLRESISIVPISILTIILIWFMPLKVPKYYCSFWIESIPIFYGLVTVSSLFNLLLK